MIGTTTKPQPSWMGEGGTPSNRGRGPDLTACLVGLWSHLWLHWGHCSTRTGTKYVGSLVCTESLRMYVGYTYSFSIRFFVNTYDTVHFILIKIHIIFTIAYNTYWACRGFFFSRKSVAPGWSVTPFFWAKRPLSPPQKKPASAAKPILACLYKTITLMLYNLINLPNLIGARHSCGQYIAFQIGCWNKVED
jgi:hypothetical protein